MRRNTALRLRQHRGQQLLPEFRSRLATVLGYQLTPTDILDIETTERLRDAFFEKVKHKLGTQGFIWDTSDASDVWSTTADIGSRLAGTKAILFHAVDEYIGAVSVPADSALTKAQEVWWVVQQDLCLCTPDLSDGFCLEFNHYSDRDEYELTCWGIFAYSSPPGHDNEA